ncbi:hypothetical protein MKZ38_004255 [Zalerion maritima]|uniref:Uncharacterized protein n=1 Tax=Zalerion maritima TaxID=339359 RepID=A0AAD5WR54_9PEZI|nr:hypothetical protein MKZ38_004255 [Zalerion maritima]
MFRDESSKVIQKAHAQWGVADSPGSSSQAPQKQELMSTSLLPASSSSLGRASISSGSSPASRPSFSSYSPRSTICTEYDAECPAQPTASSRTPYSSGFAKRQHGSSSMALGPPRLPQPQPLWMPLTVGPTMEEQGVQFYTNHYLLGHPDEPPTMSEIKDLNSLFHPALQDVIAAVGLAGLSNLNGDSEMNDMSRRKYISALNHTGKLITKAPSAASPRDLDNILKTVVMMALFEVVKGTHHSAHSVNAHIIGATNFMSTIVPKKHAPAGGVRGLIQLGYSLLIPCHASGTNVPDKVFKAIEFAMDHLPDHDQPVGNLGILATRYLQISSFVKRTVLTDGRPTAERTLQQLLALEEDFEAWEAALPPEWGYELKHNSALPPTAVFQGKYHLYPDMWMARMWNHYRWSRILTNEMILDFVERFPETSISMVSALQRWKCFDVNHRLSEDVMVSTPSHWKHPHLDEKAKAGVSTNGQAGSGAVGVPALLHHLRVAGCTPGISTEAFEWTYRLVQSVWSDMGMLHARIILDMMDKHKTKLVAASS